MNQTGLEDLARLLRIFFRCQKDLGLRIIKYVLQFADRK